MKSFVKMREVVVLVDATSRDERLRTAALVWLIALLIFLPLAFGATEEWSITVMHIVSAILLSLWAIQVSSAETPEISLPLNLWPATAFGVLIMAQWAFSLSAYRLATFRAFLNYCAYAILLFVTVQLIAAQRKTLRRIAGSLATFGGLLAIASIAFHSFAPGRLYGVREPRWGGLVFGPYVNRNHYAGLMEMLAPLAVAFAVTNRSTATRLLAAVAAGVMYTSVFLSLSRGGMVSLVAGGVVLLALLPRRTELSRGTVWGTLAIIVVVGALLVAADEEVLGRVSDMRDAHRKQITADSMTLVREQPVFGWGLGTFATVFPRAKTFYTDYFVNEAHNDYVQVLVETGVVGLALALLFLGFTYRSALRRIRRGGSTAAVRCCALAGITSIAVHSTVDFNLQIPANAAMFFVMCALAAAPGSDPSHAAGFESHS